METLQGESIPNTAFPRIEPAGYICFSFSKLWVIFQEGLYSRVTSI